MEREKRICACVTTDLIFVVQMLGQMRTGDSTQAPEERFASQLDQLASMGFVDRQANIQGKPWRGCGNT